MNGRLDWYNRWTGYRGYLFALIATGLAGLIRWLLEPLVGDEAHYVPFFVSVAVVAIVAGLRAGMVSVLLGAITGFFFFVYRLDRFDPHSASDYIQLLGYVFACTVIAMVAQWGRMQHSAAMRSAEALAESARARSDLAAIVESSEDAIISTDLNALIRSWNQGAERLFGYPAEEMLGHSITALLPADRVHEELEILSRIRAGKTLRHFETVRAAKDGRLIQVSVSVSPVKNARGEIWGASKIIRDISEQRAVTEALLRSEAELQTIVENLHEGLVVCDINGEQMHWNRAALRMHRFKSFDQVKRNLNDFTSVFQLSELSGRVLAFEEWPMLRILRGETVDRWELRIFSLQEKWEGIFSYSGAMATDSKGKRLALLSINDITHRFYAEEALRRTQDDLKRAQALSQTGSWRLDIDKDELIWSDEAYRIFGVPLGTPLHYQNFIDAVHPEDREMVNARWEAAIRGAPYDLEHRIVVKGKIKWVREKAELEFDADGKLRSGFGAVHDITERKASEVALATAKYAAEQARTVAEKANRAKDDFLAALSHELRTPLTPVLMMAGMMERDPELPDDLRQDFAIIRRNISMEAQLIDDLLDLTRIERGKMELDLTDANLHDVIRHSLELMDFQAKAKALDVQLHLHAPDPHVHGDPVRLRQVFWNLLSNAVKFTPESGSIEIRTSSPEPGRVLVEIADSGIGMRPEEIARAFDAFAQGDHAREGRRFGGLGLGLSISRKLVEMHEGQIWAESMGQGRGTTFFVELPIRVPMSSNGNSGALRTIEGGV